MKIQNVTFDASTDKMVIVARYRDHDLKFDVDFNGRVEVRTGTDFIAIGDDPVRLIIILLTLLHNETRDTDALPYVDAAMRLMDSSHT